MEGIKYGNRKKQKGGNNLELSSKIPPYETKRFISASVGKEKDPAGLEDSISRGYLPPDAK